MFVFGFRPCDRFLFSAGVCKHDLGAFAATATAFQRHRFGLYLCSGFNRLFHLQQCCPKNFWNERSIFSKRCAPVGMLPLFFSGPFSSGLCFFSKSENENVLGDEAKCRSEFASGNSPNKRLWTNVLLAINVIAYVAQTATDGKLILWGAKINSLIDQGQLWRLVTSSFLHANIGHLVINCYSLYSIGPTVEAISGPRRFLSVYLTSAIASSTMSYYLCKAPSVGASGAVFGLVGSYAMHVLRHRNLFGGGTEHLRQIANVIALNMAFGLLSKGIDNWGHLGGLLAGASTSWFLGPMWKYQYRSRFQKAVLVDDAPVFRFLNWVRRK